MELDKGLFLPAMAEANSAGSENKLLDVTKHKTDKFEWPVINAIIFISSESH